MEITPVAYFHSPLKTKFGIPKQSGLAQGLKGYITFSGEWKNADALRGIDGFDYLWLIWGFSANRHEARGTTVRPPVLGGNTRVGVWATRSPFRPNGLGLSAVRIERVEIDAAQGPVIHVSGADLMDNTPIYDIKPYVPYADAYPGVRSGFTGLDKLNRLNVVVGDEVSKTMGERCVAALAEVLALDPRPQYHNDADRVYGMAFDKWDIKFTVSENTVSVIGCEERNVEKSLIKH